MSREQERALRRWNRAQRHHLLWVGTALAWLRHRFGGRP